MSKSSSTLGCILLSFIYALAIFHRMAFPAAAGDISLSTGMPMTSLVDIGSTFFWAYFALLIPMGILCDVIGPTRGTIVACLLTAIGSVAFATAPGEALLATGRILIAAGSTLAFLSMLSYTALYFTDRFGAISGRGLLVGNLGGLGAGIPLMFCLTLLSWRNIWLVLAGVSFVCAVLMYVVAPKPPVMRGFKQTLGKVIPELNTVFRDSRIYVGMILSASLAGTFYAVSGSGFHTIVEAAQLNQQTEGRLLLVFVTSFAIGAFLWGRAGDNPSTRPRLIIGSQIGLMGAWYGLQLLHPSDPPTLYTIFVVIGILLGSFSVVYKMAEALFPPTYAGTVSAAVNCGMPVGALLCQKYVGGLHGFAAAQPCLWIAGSGLIAAIVFLALPDRPSQP
jgi:MFS family permease